MNRNSICQCTILYSRKMGESHRVISLLSAEGLLDAIAYGTDGRRGRLRHAATLFSNGETFLYTNPLRRPSKIVDFVITRTRNAIRENLHRFSHASLWSECITRSYAAGGDTAGCYRLYNAALDALERCVTPLQMDLASARFVWRFLFLNGVRPAIKNCSHCGASLMGIACAYWSSASRAIWCSSCYQTNAMERDDLNPNNVIKLPPSLLDFFNVQIALPFEELLHSYSSNKYEACAIREFACRFTEHYLDRKLLALGVLRQIE